MDKTYSGIPTGPILIRQQEEEEKKKEEYVVCNYKFSKLENNSNDKAQRGNSGNTINLWVIIIIFSAHLGAFHPKMEQQLLLFSVTEFWTVINHMSDVEINVNHDTEKCWDAHIVSLLTMHVLLTNLCSFFFLCFSRWESFWTPSSQTYSKIQITTNFIAISFSSFSPAVSYFLVGTLSFSGLLSHHTCRANCIPWKGQHCGLVRKVIWWYSIYAAWLSITLF